MTISPSDRLLLFGASLLAAYQVVAGIEGLSSFTILCYTIGFGVILVACLLMIILGFDVLESSLVVILSTLIPLSLSTGLIAEFYPDRASVYLVFAALGLLAVGLTRVMLRGKVATIVLAIVHGVAGVIIFALPVYLAMRRMVPAGFSLVGVGGALIGVGGLLLFFMRTGSQILSKERILRLFPGLLLLTTAAFVAGFLLGKI